jgi:hypothetical protein
LLLQGLFLYKKKFKKKRVLNEI